MMTGFGSKSRSIPSHIRVGDSSSAPVAAAAVVWGGAGLHGVADGCHSHG